MYEAGHSLGGIVLETWAKDNADMSTGIILYGSYLANGFGGNGDTNVFPVPVLTAMGSLDGGALSYVTREARESHNPGMIFRKIMQYSQISIIKLRKGLDTVESLSVEGKGSKTLGKIFLVL